MKQQPDRLFRNKLRNYSKSVPDSAWDRIEAGIEKKPYPFYKLAVAASLLLLSVCIYIFWPSSLSEQKTIAQQNEAKPNQSAQQKNERVIKEDIKRSSIESKAESKTQKSVERENHKPMVPAETKVPTLVEKQKTNFDTLENDFQEEIIIAENTEEKTDTSATGKNESGNLFIVFTAEDTKEYLAKRIPEEATTEEENASTFTKVLRKARDLKNNQDPYGDLRQMKNEILALNFKSDKRGQKK